MLIPETEHGFSLLPEEVAGAWHKERRFRCIFFWMVVGGWVRPGEVVRVRVIIGKALGMAGIGETVGAGVGVEKIGVAKMAMAARLVMNCILKVAWLRSYW